MSTKGYVYVPSDQIHLGLLYSDLCISWFKWLVGTDPDGHNNGPVFYLRGMDFAPHGGHYYNYIKVGKNKLKVPEGRPIFWPIIFYYLSQFHYPSLNEQQMYRLLTKWMDAGDNPPSANQVIIDGEPITDNFTGKRVISPVFELTIPDVDVTYGKSFAPLFTDEPFTSPGTWKCIAGGYFVLLKDLKARDEPYTIVSHGRGELGYITDTVVQIQVQSVEPTGVSGLKGVLPGENKGAKGQADELTQQVLPHLEDEGDKTNISELIKISHGLIDPRQIVCK